MPERLHIEVAYAEPGRQFLRALELPVGSVIADAITCSGIEAEFEVDAEKLAVGIWSKVATRQTVLADGDRVELYRPLKVDPKDARRARAGKRKS